MSSKWFHGAQEVDFASKDGSKIVTRYYRIGQIPESVSVRGERYIRLYSAPAPVGPVVGAPGGSDRLVVAHSLPRNHPNAPRVNKQGKPVFINQREINEFCKKSQDTDGEYHAYE